MQNDDMISLLVCFACMLTCLCGTLFQRILVPSTEANCCPNRIRGVNSSHHPAAPAGTLLQHELAGKQIQEQKENYIHCDTKYLHVNVGKDTDLAEPLKLWIFSLLIRHSYKTLDMCWWEANPSGSGTDLGQCSSRHARVMFPGCRSV